MNYFVYVLKNMNNKLYIGQTSDIDKRILEHNEFGNGYTSKFRPWKFVYLENFSSRKEAMAREEYFKTGVGREFVKNKIGGA